MAIIVGGYLDGTGGEVETTHAALRVSGWPYDVVALNEEHGAYSLGMDNGTTVITAGAQTDQEIWQFRWTDPLTCACIRSLKVNFGTQIAFVAGQFKLALFFATLWTGAGTGGVTATLTGRNLRKRSSFASTVLGEARIATTAVLGAGTKTLDAQPLATISAAAPTVIGPIYVNQSMMPELNRDTSDEYGVVLTQNEGLVLRTTYPATGTPFFSVQIEWMEFPANEFFG